MGKNKKPRQSNRIRNGAPPNGGNRRPTSGPTASPPALPSKRRFLLWSAWKGFWAFFGPIVAVIGAWFNFKPNLTVEPSVNIDPSRQYATQILITNRGHVPIFNLAFSCGFGVGGGTTTIDGKLSAPDIRPQQELAAGQAITRSCDVGALSIGGNQRLSFQTTYQWPLFGHKETKDAIFDIRKGVPGYFLVPDALR